MEYALGESENGLMDSGRWDGCSNDNKIRKKTSNLNKIQIQQIDTIHAYIRRLMDGQIGRQKVRKKMLKLLHFN